MSQSILGMAKDLVQAQITAGQLSPDEMQEVLQQTYTSLMALKTLEEMGGVPPVQNDHVAQAPVHWRKSITKHTVTCLACGATFKQLSVRHLREHGLDGRSYRTKYGIPRTQPLSAKETTAKRKQVIQQSRPWEKAPTYMKAHEEKNGKAPSTTKSRTRRTRTARAKG